MVRTPLLQIEDARKRFGNVVALDGVTMTVSAGEVVGLLGHNGAGKSTLVKAICGEIALDHGTVRIRGKLRTNVSQIAAAQEGVVTVYQDGGLCPSLSGARNVQLLLHQLPRWEKVRKSQVSSNTQQLLDQVFPGHGIGLSRPVEELTVGQRQLLEIARAIQGAQGGAVLILDEPTAAIGAEAAGQLFKWMRAERERGAIGIVLITHRLGEIQGQTDRTVVLRNGQVVYEGASEQLQRQQLIGLMGGQAEAEEPEQAQGMPRSARIGSGSETAINARGVRCGRFPATCDVVVRRGELVGLGGLANQGQRELLDAIFYEYAHHKGRRRLRKQTDVRINGHLAYVTGDRSERGIFEKWSVAENLAVTVAPSLGRFGFVSSRRIREFSEKWMRELEIRASDAGASIGSLSGGSQQKVLIARALGSGAEILLLDDPTRGVDASTKEALTKLLIDFVESGGTCVWASSEPEELLACDRVYVLLRGSVAAELERGELTEQAVIGASFAT